MAGLVQKFVLECDSKQAVQHALLIFLGWRTVTHYRTFGETLVLMWAADKNCVGVQAMGLADWKNVEGLTKMVAAWVLTQDYGPEPDIAGSCIKGYHITTPPYDNPYDVCHITPCWIEYHK